MSDLLAAAAGHKATLESELIEVEIPELSMSVWVSKSMSMREAMKIEEARSMGNLAQVLRAVTIFCLTQEGKRVFSDAQEQDVSVKFEFRILSKVAERIDDIKNWTSGDDAKKN